MMSELKIKEVKERYETEWFKLKGVVAIGIGVGKEDQLEIIVSVSKGINSVRAQIPNQVEGVLVSVQQVNPIKAD